MASSSLAHPKTKSEDSDLITSLLSLSKKAPKLVKSSLYSAPADVNIKVRSWKMNEFKYYDVPSPFPSLARGIFSVDLEEEEGKHRIVARGYDKFFNIGEVPWTTWEFIQEHTTAPYTLSLKSNGCIIFIAALTPEKLLITSKHSIGPTAGKTRSHAEVGEEWLQKYLEKLGKTETDLAAKLWQENWTAVAELCDDSFEEHVLPYRPESTGLHLHGLNSNSKAFVTMDHATVDAFAKAWGFIQTRSVVKQSVDEVREFCDAVEKDGVWEGEAVEGFVVRTSVLKEGKSPYPPGSSFFFKVKFDEPYMMYRDWREVTKMLLSAEKKGPLNSSALPKAKLRRPETRLYVNWVIGEIKRNKAQFNEFGNGKGIISTRERFLSWAEKEGKIKIRGAKIQLLHEHPLPPPQPGQRGKDPEKEFGKTVIVPVAIPGCGKTTVALALSNIFGFGHTQSDDVKVKKAAPVFIKNVVNLLNEHDVVIADKNNHLKQHRSQLREAVNSFEPPVRLLALNWSSFLSSEDKRLQDSEIKQICSSRIVSRGTNHQTLLADEEGRKHEEVLLMFLKKLEELTPDEVDEIVEMPLEEVSETESEADAEKEIETQVNRAVEGIVRVLGLEMPSKEKIRAGVVFAREYTATPAKDRLNEMRPSKTRAPRYYALVPQDLDVPAILESVFDLPERDSAGDGVMMWKHLVNTRRLVRKPHVTIVHTKSCQPQGQSSEDVKEAQDLWDRCASLAAQNAMFEFKLNSVVWDGRTMALAIEDLKIAGSDAAQKAAEFIKILPSHVRDKMHITVGTSNGAVPPVEAGIMVSNWRPRGLAKNSVGVVSQIDSGSGKGGNGNISGTQGIMCVRLEERVVRARMVGLFE